MAGARAPRYGASLVRGSRRARWATCALTQLGFVRITSNPTFSRDALSPIEATALLAANLTHPGHEFWAEALQVPDAIDTAGARVQGYRQLTDAYLLALASRRKGVLAAFDRGLRTIAEGDFDSALEVVPTR